MVIIDVEVENYQFLISSPSTGIVMIELLDQAPSDEALLARSQSEPQCFATIITRYEDAFWRKGRRIISDENLLADVIQDAFVKIYLNAGKFRSQTGATFRSWAYRIFINTCFSAYKQQKREREFIATLDPELLALAPDEKTLLHESRWAFDDLLVLISRLPKLLGRVAQLHLIEGRTQAEVAKIEGVTIGAVRTRLHRAKQALRALVLKSVAYA